MFFLLKVATPKVHMKINGKKANVRERERRSNSDKKGVGEPKSKNRSDDYLLIHFHHHLMKAMSSATVISTHNMEKKKKKLIDG